MIEHVIDVSETPARLSVRNNLLVVLPDGGEEVTVPMEEVRALVVSNRRTMYTNALLAALSGSGGVLVVCDEKHMPCGMLMPLAANTRLSRRLTIQAKATQPQKKQAWAQIIKHKIKNQASALITIHGKDYGLRAMAAKVRSGDPDNIEARAARKYWTALFGSGFKRGRDGVPPNGLLNYGYAVLRAMTARALAGTGLSPSLGVHHHNQYDQFCLASDMMEPFRPVVDVAVARLVEDGEDEVTKDNKRALLSALTSKYKHKGEAWSLFRLAEKASVSLYGCLSGSRKKLDLPEFVPDEADKGVV